MQNLITNTIKSLTDNFQNNELAFLALTTKIELPFRDRWAFSIFNEIEMDFNVSREWKRTDLAILKGKTPQVLVELKAMYSFDAALDPDGIGGFTDAMSADAKKAKNLAVEETEIYTVLLVTHPSISFSPEMDGIVKYVPGINRAIDKFGSALRVKEVACEAVDNDLKNRNVVASGELNGGKAFGAEVSVLYWIVKA
ncbi:MAG: hypothetical protein ACI87Q_002603 [Pseudohongiellaceae bacterium]